MLRRQVNELCGRLGELMEAGGVAIPDLQRAAAPVIENTRQDCIQLRLLPGRGRTTYSLLMNLRAYLALADSVPKPFPFSGGGAEAVDGAARRRHAAGCAFPGVDREPRPAAGESRSGESVALCGGQPEAGSGGGGQAARGVLWGFDHRLLALERILSGQRLYQSRNCGTDQRAVIAAHEGRRDRSASRGGADSDRHQRSGARGSGDAPSRATTRCWRIWPRPTRSR